MSHFDTAPLSDGIKAAWQKFLDECEALRPQLYRYCRHLTRNAWDAEDLTQDALMRAFVTLGTTFHPVENPKAWLFRIASNAWLDRVRRQALERGDTSSSEVALDAQDPRASREAAATLISALSPRERVAVLLKDVFAFTLEEVAAVLGTTTGAVKAALHGGRSRLAEERHELVRSPAPGALDAFCEAFSARDLEALTALLLDGAIVEIVGVVTEYGKEQPKDPRSGSLAGMLSPITSDERGGVADEYLQGYEGGLPRAEVRAYRDEWVLLLWYPHADGEAVRAVMRLECGDEAVSRVRNYFFSPDVIAEVCGELDVPYRCNGYRYWV